MAAMTIRNIDDGLKARLRVRAAMQGKSMEDEARDILRAVLATDPIKPRNLAQSIRDRVAPLGGVDIPSVPREAIRTPADFQE